VLRNPIANARLELEYAGAVRAGDKRRVRELDRTIGQIRYQLAHDRYLRDAVAPRLGELVPLKWWERLLYGSRER
jgi:hypothetical protein